MIYRLSTVKDINRLAELMWEQKNEDSPLDPAGKPEYVQVCSKYMKHRLHDDYFCWVADDDGLIVSHIHILITRKLPKPGNLNSFYGRLSQVRTIPGYRNRGIGSELMSNVIR